MSASNSAMTNGPLFIWTWCMMW